jgi:hypothetical protein
MIGLALSFSMTNHSSADAMTQARHEISIAKTNEPVAMMPRTVAQAPMIMIPSSPRFHTPDRCARTPAMVTYASGVPERRIAMRRSFTSAHSRIRAARRAIRIWR